PIFPMQDLMRAAVLHKPGDIRVENVPKPEVTPGHVLNGLDRSSMPHANGTTIRKYPVFTLSCSKRSASRIFWKNFRTGSCPLVRHSGRCYLRSQQHWVSQLAR